MNSNTNITIRPACSSDLIHLTRLDLAANSNHPLIALSFPYPFLATKVFLERLKFCFDRPERYRFLVATKGGNDGEVVGFLMWDEKEGDGDSWDWEERLPKGTDLRLWKFYTKVMGDDGLRSAEGGIKMEVLAVAPVHQRRGIGTLLLQTFIHEMERLGEREVISVRASKNARSLYENFGWRVTNEYKMNLRDWGRHSIYVNYGMVRNGSKNVVEEARL